MRDTPFKLDYYDIGRCHPDDAPETWPDGHLMTRVSDTRPTKGMSVVLEGRGGVILVGDKPLSGEIVATATKNPAVLGWDFGAWLRLDTSLSAALVRLVGQGKTRFDLDHHIRDPEQQLERTLSLLKQAERDGFLEGVRPRRARDRTHDAIFIDGGVTQRGQDLLGGRISVNDHIATQGRPPSDAPPRAFISYSWDSDAHQGWVRALAERLVRDGVEVHLDQFDLRPGLDLVGYMETQIREADFVLCVCTPSFAAKANGGTGGVGYEKSVITGEILQGIGAPGKFIPVVRDGELADALPSYLRTLVHLDFRSDDHTEEYERLIRTIHDEPQYASPPVGGKPTFESTPAQGDRRSAELSDLQRRLLDRLRLGDGRGVYAEFAQQELGVSFEEARFHLEQLVAAELLDSEEDDVGAVVYLLSQEGRRLLFGR